MNLIGKLGDPQADAAALKPLEDSALARIDALTTELRAWREMLMTGKISISFEKKEQS